MAISNCPVPVHHRLLLNKRLNTVMHYSEHKLLHCSYKIYYKKVKCSNTLIAMYYHTNPLVTNHLQLVSLWVHLSREPFRHVVTYRMQCNGGKASLITFKLDGNVAYTRYHIWIPPSQTTKHQGYQVNRKCTVPSRLIMEGHTKLKSGVQVNNSMHS